MKRLQLFSKCIKCKHSEKSCKDPFAPSLLVVSSVWGDENTLQLFLVLVNICCLIIFFFSKQPIHAVKDIRLPLPYRNLYQQEAEISRG